jgi:predicted amidophosphoribosyltransferase
VPLHPARRRRRGFNQAERLAAALVARTGLPLADCLRRERAPQQVGRPRAERTQASGFAAARPPPTVLLVDDVVTTGGTLAACAAALRSAGSSQIAAVAFARTLAR